MPVREPSRQTPSAVVRRPAAKGFAPRRQYAVAAPALAWRILERRNASRNPCASRTALKTAVSSDSPSRIWWNARPPSSRTPETSRRSAQEVSADGGRSTRAFKSPSEICGAGSRSTSAAGRPPTVLLVRVQRPATFARAKPGDQRGPSGREILDVFRQRLPPDTLVGRNPGGTPRKTGHCRWRPVRGTPVPFLRVVVCVHDVYARPRNGPPRFGRGCRKNRSEVRSHEVLCKQPTRGTTKSRIAAGVMKKPVMPPVPSRPDRGRMVGGRPTSGRPRSG